MELCWLLLFLFLILILPAVLFLIIYLMLKQRANKKIKKIYRSYGKRTDARIRRQRTVYTRTNQKYCVDVEFEFLYEGNAHTLFYTIHSSNKLVKEYSNFIPIIYIPEYFLYRYRIISKKEIYQMFDEKVSLTNPWKYPMVMFENDFDRL